MRRGTWEEIVKRGPVLPPPAPSFPCRDLLPAESQSLQGGERHGTLAPAGTWGGEAGGYILDVGVGADDVLYLIGIRVLEGEAAGVINTHSRFLVRNRYMTDSTLAFSFTT